MQSHLINLESHDDLRGNLLTLEFTKLPSSVNRIFLIDVNSIDYVRGGHAHKMCWQTILSIQTEIIVTCEDSKGTNSFHVLPGLALVIPPMTWVTITFTSINSYCLVMASHAYDPNDYIFSKLELGFLS